MLLAPSNIIKWNTNDIIVLVRTFENVQNNLANFIVHERIYTIG